MYVVCHRFGLRCGLLLGGRPRHQNLKWRHVTWAWNPDASIKVAHPRKPPWLVPLTRAFIDLLADPVPGGYPGRRGST